jgi:hypothetical protein
MPELNDEQLDNLLGDSLNESLDPQRGRAEAYFRQYLRGEARVAWKQRAWLIGAFVGGMAASVAALWAAPWFRAADPSPHRSPVSQATSPQLIAPAVQRVVNSQTIDEGVLVLDDNTPVRVLRRRAVERTRWFNQEEQVQREQVTPKDDFVFIKLTTN